MDSASQSRLNPFRALPVAFALILNVVVGPLGPVVSQLAPERVMGYVGDATTFELDGNAVHNTGHDWDQVYADRNGPPYPNSGAINQAFKVDGFDAGDDILTGGSTKDVNNISSWAWKSRQGPGQRRHRERLRCGLHRDERGQRRRTSDSIRYQQRR